MIEPTISLFSSPLVPRLVFLSLFLFSALSRIHRSVFSLQGFPATASQPQSLLGPPLCLVLQIFPSSFCSTFACSPLLASLGISFSPFFLSFPPSFLSVYAGFPALLSTCSASLFLLFVPLSSLSRLRFRLSPLSSPLCASTLCLSRSFSTAHLLPFRSPSDFFVSLFPPRPQRPVSLCFLRFQVPSSTPARLASPPLFRRFARGVVAACAGCQDGERQEKRSTPRPSIERPSSRVRKSPASFR